MNKDRTITNLEFLEGLIKEGRMLATQRDDALALLSFAAGQGGALNFGEGGKVSFDTALKSFFRGQPIKSAAVRLNAFTEEKMEQAGLSYSEAFLEVQLEHPNLTRAYIHGGVL